MQKQKETLERRLVQLEARVGGPQGDRTTEELVKLRQRLQQGYPSLETLVRRLRECNVDTQSGISAEGDFEREAVLGSYSGLETAVAQLETMLEQQDAIFTRFRAIHAQLGAYDDEALLQTLRRIEERYTRLVRRLLLLLEERALLRHREEALMVSVTCATSTRSIDK